MADTTVLTERKIEQTTPQADEPVAEQSDWDQMTPAERKADVDKLDSAGESKTEKETPVVEDAAASSEGSEKDANISAKGDETTAEDDAAEIETKVEGEGQAETDWRDADVNELASMYGLDGDMLAAIPSREVLDTVLKAIDKKAFEAGKQKQTDQTTTVQPAEKPVVREMERTAKPQTEDRLNDLEQFKLGEELGSDDAPAIANAFSAVTAELKELREWRSLMQERERRQAVENIRQKAVESLQSLGFPEWVGKPGETISKDIAANIDKIMEAHFIHAKGMIESGRHIAPNPHFMKAALFQVFGDQLFQKQKERIIEDVRKQAKKRSGGTGTKHAPQQPPVNESQEQFRKRIAADPEVAAAVRRFYTEDE